MKKLFGLIMGMFVAITLYPQQRFEEVPVEYGKIVFSQTVYTPLSKDEIYKKLSAWLNDDYSSKYTKFRVEDAESGTIVLQNMELLEIEKKKLSVYEVYMRYNLIIECGNNQYSVQLKNISYADADKLNDGNGNSSFLSAETVIIGNSYKQAFVKNASGKIREKSLEYINNLLTEMQIVLNNP